MYIFWDTHDRDGEFTYLAQVYNSKKGILAQVFPKDRLD
jgi:hypothetical protein